ncbi:MAG: aminodeoxychorismate lyase [Alphaproteobacteria bacterium]|nr:MAG: aminodeoxychorismate lyase [Alphaproteobacteria bacterium]
MKLFFKIILGGFVLLSTMGLLGVAGGSLWAYQKFNMPNTIERPVTIIVPRGANIGGVADILLDEGLIDSPMIFTYGGRLTEQASKLKAGEYEILPRLSMKQILDVLEKGKTVQRNVTIREGLTSHEIVNLLMQTSELKTVRIEPLAEGSLLPETYSYSKGETIADVIGRMESAMQKVLDEAWAARSPDLPLKTKEEALILASIIEKETAIGLEHRKVSGVFINRLRKGMLLQTDPTVIYALTKGKPKNEGKGPLGRRLLLKDLKVDSPYNTYRYAGLPPGPITNPGRAAIEAALNPEEHRYIYFVADGSGGHAFARTLSEHNNNVAKWRKIRKNK